MKKNFVPAIGIIDVQRGFMPASEHERLGYPGFGELPVAGGHEVVPVINELVTKIGGRAYYFATQDWHPPRTAHFSETPNFTTTWPVHCVENTPGSGFHPELELDIPITTYRKGNEELRDAEQDTSYSGYNGLDWRGHTLGERLEENRITHVYLGGLALDYCVAATAEDIKQKAALEVAVITDATRAVAETTGQAACARMEAQGIRLLSAHEATEEILKLWEADHEA